ncbi:MAG: flagellar biosynthetic protein FliP, partial [Hungatella sp.]
MDVNGNGIPTLEIVVMMTIVALIPSILVMMTSFARIIIILSFTRNAMGIQQVPPNMVMTGLALFLTLFIMSPVIGKVN